MTENEHPTPIKRTVKEYGFQPGHPQFCKHPRAWTDEQESAIADEMVEWMMQEGNLFAKEFLLLKRLDDSWINRACARNDHVAKQYQFCKEIQEAKIVKGALLDSGFNAHFAKFILTNKHKENWAEKTQVQHSGDGINPVVAVINMGQQPSLVDCKKLE